MADEPTLEQISQLLDDKLRPIHAKLEEHARQLARIGSDLEPQGRFKRPITLLALFIILAASLTIAGQIVLGRTGGNAGQPSPGAGRLLYTDDFSNPAGGLFLDHQIGTATLPGDKATAHWDYGYRDGALVAHVSAPTRPLEERVIGSAARSANRLTGDFAFEVRARATAAAANALYGLRYYPGGREFGFGIQPGQKSYMLWELFQPPLIAARNSAIAGDDADNFLRMEVRGSAVRPLVNGQAIDSRQDEAFGARPATVGLLFDSVASPGSESVEIRYSDFKVYALS